MSSIVIRRKEEFANRNRNIDIYVDGARAGSIASGETSMFDLEPGTHKIEAKIDWCGSRALTLEIKDNEVKDIELSGFKSAVWFINLALFLMAAELLLHKGNILPYLIVFSMVPCIILMYYITIGRRQYLTLELAK